MFFIDVFITQTCILASVEKSFQSYIRSLERQGNNYWVLGGVSVKDVNKEKSISTFKIVQ